MNLLTRLYQKVVSAYHFITDYGQHLPLAAKAVFNISCTVMTLRGSIRGSDDSVVLLYVGRRWNEEFLLNLFFESHEILSCDDVNVFTARAHSEDLARDADVEIIDIGWPYGSRLKKHQHYLEFADWLNMVLPLEGDWDDIVRSFRNTTRNNDLRLIRRNEYRFEATNDARCR